jgi:hypothetical protein
MPWFASKHACPPPSATIAFDASSALPNVA